MPSEKNIEEEITFNNLFEIFSSAKIGLYNISIKPQIKILFCNEAIRDFLGKHYDEIIKDPLKIKKFLSETEIRKIKDNLKTKADINEIIVEWNIKGKRLFLKLINYYKYDNTKEIKEIFGLIFDETEKVQLLNELKESEENLKFLNKLSIIENKAKTKEEYFQVMLDLLISKFKFKAGSVYKKYSHSFEYALVYEYNSKDSFNNFSLNNYDKKIENTKEKYFGSEITLGNFEEVNNKFNIVNSNFKFFVSIPIIFTNYQYGLILLVTDKKSNLVTSLASKKELLKKIQSSISSAIMRYILSENLYLLNKKTVNINKELVEFNEAISHDIKNGLASIVGFLELYELNKNKQFLDKVYSKIEYLTKILESNLELAKAGLSVKLKLVKKFEKIIREVADITIPQEIEYIQDNFTIDLFCDVEKIRQVFTNIFDNAVKHGKPTKITLELIERDTDILFIISNNGKPIPLEELNLIFNRGFSSNGESTGLGLNIVKKIIETHNGTITVESSSELTSFIFSLPKQ